MNGKSYYHRLKDEQTRAAVLQWWKRLHGLHDDGDGKYRANQRGARAELRRSESLDSVLLTEGFRNLWQLLGQSDQRRDQDMLAWACVAAALAEVREEPTEKEKTFAQCLGEQKGAAGKPCMSELRFAQLQKSRSDNDFLMRLRRALALINKTAPVLSLTDDILHWFHEQQGYQSSRPMDRLVVRWATNYFTALSTYAK